MRSTHGMVYADGSSCSNRPREGRSAAGMVTAPSAFWAFSRSAASVRPTARPEPFKVCTHSVFPCTVRKRACETEIASAKRHFAIRQFELLQNRLGIRNQFLQCGVRRLGRHDVHQLNFVKLMLTDQSARIFAVTARF